MKEYNPYLRSILLGESSSFLSQLTHPRYGGDP
jgi:hypothetical protein